MLTLKHIFQETKRIKEIRILLWFHKSLQCLASWMTAGFSYLLLSLIFMISPIKRLLENFTEH